VRGVKPGFTPGSVWRCNAYHTRDGEVVWSQWFTYRPDTEPCPEHGTEFLQKDEKE
jgi:hypothetical protein